MCTKYDYGYTGIFSQFQIVGITGAAGVRLTSGGDNQFAWCVVGWCVQGHRHYTLAQHQHMMPGCLHCLQTVIRIGAIEGQPTRQPGDLRFATAIPIGSLA